MVTEKHENIISKYSEIWDNLKNLLEKTLLK